MRGRPILRMQFAREVAAIGGSERGQDEAVLVEEVGDERLHLLVADGVDRREHGVDREERAQVHLVLGEPIHPARRRLERQHQAALQMILGASELLLRHAALLYLTELLEDRLENLGEVRRVARGIDVERPRVDVRLDARMDRVDEPLAYVEDRKSTRLNSSHLGISYAVFCLKKKKTSFVTRHEPIEQ